MYSEACQDEFVNISLGQPKTGFFVDVGACCYDMNGKHHENRGSNTFMLEQMGWNGIAIDMDIAGLKHRKCKCISATIGDGTNETSLLGELLKKIDSTPQLVDYLSIDIEGQDFNAVKSFHDAGYRFKIATIEHNLYSRNPGVDQLKEDIFFFLSKLGYVRIVDNAGHRGTLKNLSIGYPYEDWYIDPNHIDYKWLSKQIIQMQQSP
jgi:hypothetical protein